MYSVTHSQGTYTHAHTSLSAKERQKNRVDIYMYIYKALERARAARVATKQAGRQASRDKVTAGVCEAERKARILVKNRTSEHYRVACRLQQHSATERARV